MKKEIKNNEVMNTVENVSMDEETMQAIIDDNIEIVPKNQRKKFDALSLEAKIAKLQFYQDIAAMKAEAKVTQNSALSYDIKIIAMDKHIDETFNELMGNPTWHYYVRGGVMHLIERSDIIEIEISDIIQKRIVNKKP